MFRFNTLRQYTWCGQRMACECLSDGRVLFCDVDRSIEGITEKPAPANLTPHQMQVWVMFEYDHCRYQGVWSDDPEEFTRLRHLQQALTEFAYDRRNQAEDLYQPQAEGEHHAEY